MQKEPLLVNQLKLKKDGPTNFCHLPFLDHERREKTACHLCTANTEIQNFCSLSWVCYQAGTPTLPMSILSPCEKNNQLTLQLVSTCPTQILL